MIDVSQLKNNDDIKYIYLIPNSLFEDKKQYILIGDIPTANEDNVFCYSLEDWFLKMKSGDLIPYACATLSKKYKPKEFLNIYDKPDLLSFRKYILNCDLSEWEIQQQLYWALQIIDEFKINRYDAFASKIDFKALFSEFLNRLEGMVEYSIKSL
jgi:hypothetical protein